MSVTAQESVESLALDYRLENGEVVSYTIERINVADTYTDRFQRPPNERWLNRDLDPLMLGVAILSERQRRNKQFSVIDGQHRIELCRRNKHPWIAAIVFFNLTIQQEADLFSRYQQERRGITPFQRFQADLIAGNSQAQAVERIVSETGLKLVSDSDGPGMIKCVVALERIYEDDPTFLRLVLTLDQRTWRDVPGARSERMIRGLWRFVREEDDLDEDRFVDRLSRVTPSTLSTRAMQLREGHDQHGTLPGFLAEAISNAYRSRKKSR